MKEETVNTNIKILKRTENSIQFSISFGEEKDEVIYTFKDFNSVIGKFKNRLECCIDAQIITTFSFNQGDNDGMLAYFPINSNEGILRCYVGKVGSFDSLDFDALGGKKIRGSVRKYDMISDFYNTFLEEFKDQSFEIPYQDIKDSVAGTLAKGLKITVSQFWQYIDSFNDKDLRHYLNSAHRASIGEYSLGLESEYKYKEGISREEMYQALKNKTFDDETCSDNKINFKSEIIEKFLEEYDPDYDNNKTYFSLLTNRNFFIDGCASIGNRNEFPLGFFEGRRWGLFKSGSVSLDLRVFEAFKIFLESIAQTRNKGSEFYFRLDEREEPVFAYENIDEERGHLHLDFGDPGAYECEREPIDVVIDKRDFIETLYLGLLRFLTLGEYSRTEWEYDSRENICMDLDFYNDSLYRLGIIMYLRDKGDFIIFKMVDRILELAKRKVVPGRKSSQEGMEKFEKFMKSKD